MSVKILIICLKNNKYIKEIINPVAKLSVKEFFTTNKNDFFTFRPNEKPTTPSVVCA